MVKWNTQVMEGVAETVWVLVEVLEVVGLGVRDAVLVPATR